MCTKFQYINTFTSQVTGWQVNAIEKAIRPLFADRVTYYKKQEKTFRQPDTQFKKNHQNQNLPWSQRTAPILYQNSKFTNGNFLIATIQLNLCCLLHISLGFGTSFT